MSRCKQEKNANKLKQDKQSEESAQEQSNKNVR